MPGKRRSVSLPDGKCVAIYHVVHAHEGFEEAAQALFGLVRRAQATAPGRERRLFLDIEGHRVAEGGFDSDMFELQNDFLGCFLAPFLSEISSPLLAYRNPRPQENELPEDLIIEDRRSADS